MFEYDYIWSCRLMILVCNLYLLSICRVTTIAICCSNFACEIQSLISEIGNERVDLETSQLFLLSKIWCRYDRIQYYTFWENYV